jgi:hypothetical protein
MSPGTLEQILNSHAVELRFIRRRPLPGNDHRRMLATNDTNLLNSIPGRTALNFHGAPGHLKFNPRQKGLVMTWDIFMQDFRLVPAESVEIVRAIRTTPPDEFWEYFNRVLSKMPEAQKVSFMHA